MKKITLALVSVLLIFTSCDLLAGQKKADPEPESIAVKTNPSKLDYIEGEVFESAGLVVELVYSDGSKKEIDDYSFSTAKLTAEDSKVTITKDDFSVDVPVTVQAVVGVDFDYSTIKANYGEFKIEGPEGTYTETEDTITLSPAEEKVEYVISGYFKGQIINQTKNTKITLKNAFLENDSGKPVINSTKKLELSSDKNTENYLVSSGTSEEKIGAVNSEKGIELGGSGTTYIDGKIVHGIKGTEIKVKGSGRYICKGTSDGSAVNCNVFVIETGKNVKLFLVDSKNGIKADDNISVASGSLYFGNIGTAFKTDKLKDGPSKSEEGYFIRLSDCNVYTRHVKTLHNTEADCYTEENLTREDF